MPESTLFHDWVEAEATIEVMGNLTTLCAPSKMQLVGALGHISDDGNISFIRNLGKTKPINYVVDVGANIGGTALLFQSAFPDADMLAIEPVELNYKYLLLNIKRFPKITPLKMVAYDKKRTVRVSMPTPTQRKDLNIRFGNSGLYSIFGEDYEHSEVVEADTLDNIANTKVDLLKIDVEGAEFYVLGGAERFIAKDRPMLIVESRPATLEMARVTEEYSREWFKRINYKLVGKYFGDLVLCPADLDYVIWDGHEDSYGS